MDIKKKNYGKKVIFENINVELSSCNLIIGENGSGKTTLLKIFAGLIKNYVGNVDISEDTSLLLDLPCLYMYKTGAANLELFLNDEELKKSLKYINYFQMESYINKIVSKYSNGMRKKLALVIALSRNKKYLLLDEPTNSLDNESVDALKSLLKEEKKDRIIVIASHNLKMYDENLIDKVLMLKNKNLFTLEVKALNYTIFKVKTIETINLTEYDFKIIDDFYYFKVFNDKIDDFSDWISQFKIMEMVRIDSCEPIYMEDIYND